MVPFIMWEYHFKPSLTATLVLNSESEFYSEYGETY